MFARLNEMPKTVLEDDGEVPRWPEDSADHQRIAAAEAVERARAHRIRRLVNDYLGELGEEATYLLRETKDAVHSSLWEALCYTVVRGQPGDMSTVEDRVREACQQVLRESDPDWFTSEVLANYTMEYDEFYRTAARGKQPPPGCLEGWIGKQISSRVIELARDAADSSFLSYDPETLRKLVDCLHSLSEIAKGDSELEAIERAVKAVKSLENGRRAEVNMDIGCSFECGGLEFAYVVIRETGIALEILHSHDAGFGSDHWSDEFSFPGGFTTWVESFNNIRRLDGTRLSFESYD
jgi:hypothetical protein